MPLITALKQLTGDYGSVNAGDTFAVSEELAEELEAAGLVERYRPHPKPLQVKTAEPHDNKMMPPHKNK
jgi:hypothetical protein